MLSEMSRAFITKSFLPGFLFGGGHGTYQTRENVNKDLSKTVSCIFAGLLPRFFMGLTVKEEELLMMPN